MRQLRRESIIAQVYPEPHGARPMLTALLNARVLTPDEELAGATVVVRDGRIEAVGVGLTPPTGAQSFDLAGLTLAPGFIDIHVHGGGGFSLISEDPEE